MDPSIHELLVKLQALADRGVDGEREAATGRLVALMRKYRITPDDLANAQRCGVMFRWRSANERTLGIMLAQVVCQRRDVPARVLPKRRIIFYATRAQAKEWRAVFAHYRRALTRETSLFLAAFIHRQGITLPPGGKARQLTHDQMTTLLRMMGYMQKDAYVRICSLIGGYKK